MSLTARLVRFAVPIALPLGLGACVVAPPPPPRPIMVAPAPVMMAPAPRCRIEARTVWSRDSFGRPVQVVQRREVCV